MKAKDVQAGWYYWVKVTRKEVPCRVRQRYDRTRFEVVNTTTGRTILLRTAKRLRRALTLAEVEKLGLPLPKGAESIPANIPGGAVLRKALLPAERKEEACTHCGKLVIR